MPPMSGEDLAVVARIFSRHRARKDHVKPVDE
jgi:hypothetical protein